MVNVTVSGNTAAQRGGGLINDGTGIVDITNATFSNNSAANGGAIARNSDSPVSLTNTIIANSPVGGNCDGPMTTNGHNLEDADTCGLLGAMNDTIGELANLGPLADNGGPTMTHALLVGSPAVNGGDNGPCPPTDQRGIPRPQQFTCDIGAYERPALIEVVPPSHLGVPALAPMAVLATSLALLFFGSMLARRRRWRTEPAPKKGPPAR